MSHSNFLIKLLDTLNKSIENESIPDLKNRNKKELSKKLEEYENTDIEGESDINYTSNKETIEEIKDIGKIDIPKYDEEVSLDDEDNIFDVQDYYDQNEDSGYPDLKNLVDQKDIDINEVLTVEEREKIKNADETFEAKFDHWQHQLLDLGKRNRMINFKNTGRATLKILEPSLDMMYKIIVKDNKKLTFERPIDKDTDMRAFSFLALLEALGHPLPISIGDIKCEGSILDKQKNLRNMRSKSILALEEQGTNILYMACGFIEWKNDKDSKDQWIKSPLIMVPVSITIDAINAPFTLKQFDDDIVVNPTLSYLFEMEYGIELPGFDPEKESPEEFFGKMDQLVNKRGWKITRESSIGLFSFLKISMYKDLEKNKNKIKNNPVIRDMCGYPSNKNTKLSMDTDFIKNDQKVINADASQQEAIMYSRKGMSFVMQGPPGTGKSQTITNIIASALADNKKVLFVSEKMAALQVVYERLAEVGLSDFCLPIHSYKANKKAIIDEIGANLSLLPFSLSDDELKELDKLSYCREGLDKYAKELHTNVEPLGISCYECYGRLCQLDEIRDLEFAIENVEEISTNDLNYSINYLEKYALAYERAGSNIDENPWKGSNITFATFDEKEKVKSKFIKIVNDLKIIDEIYNNLQNQYSFDKKINLDILKNYSEKYFLLSDTEDIEYIKKSYKNVMSEKLKIDINIRKITNDINKDPNEKNYFYQNKYKEISQLLSELEIKYKDIINYKKDNNYIEYEEKIENLNREILNFNKNNKNDIDYIENIFVDRPISEIDITEVLSLLNNCIDNVNRADDWIDYREVRKEGVTLGFGEFIGIIEDNNVRFNEIVDIYKKRFYKLWIEHISKRFSSINEFRRNVHDKEVNDFCKLDTRQLTISQLMIKSKLLDNMPASDTFLMADDEVAILEKEMNKKRRIMPLRQLFRDIPNLLMRLKPCLMMSPLSVSYFLEAEAYHFDLVIFDEASQIFPEDAIGAIFRGNQAIIVGDSKQLPPTNFFMSTTTDNSDKYDVEEEDDFRVTVTDSILEEVVNVLPNKTLNWHYRSKNEDLISFSNKKIYKNKLITFPSSYMNVPDMGVQYVYVENGYYEGAGKNCNILEAEKCVYLVIKHIQNYPNRSLGIIAFSEKQQNVIENAINDFRKKFPKYERFFDEGKEEPFFIKNLENVQGNERDTIILSIGYAKDKNGKMYMRFGPIGQQGGERRLNVAITRARYNVKLVGSILPTDLDPDRLTSDGPKMLRSYIEFAMKGHSVLGEDKVQTAYIKEDKFVKEVKKFLEKNGYKTKLRVGSSDYKIDIGVMDPKDNNRFILGIECDGYSYNAAKTAGERDHLRKKVLENMGWDIYRVWSTEWMRNTIIEKNRLLNYIKSIIYNQNSLQRDNKTSDKDLGYNDDYNIDDYNDISFEKRDEIKIGKDIFIKYNPYDFDYYEETGEGELSQINFIDSTFEMSINIMNIIKVEQPIHKNLLYERMNQCITFKATSAAIREAIDKTISTLLFDKVKTDEDGFLWDAEFAQCKVRMPKDKKSRPFEYIPIEELALAMKTIGNDSYGVSVDNLKNESAAVFGFEKIGSRMQKRLDMAFDYLLKSQEIAISNGRVVRRKEVNTDE